MDSFWIMDHLDKKPQDPLSDFDCFIGFFTTPVVKEFLGIEGWEETGYSADGRGTLVHGAQHSTDGFWTADLALKFFRIGNLVKWGPGIYLRLEIRPGTVAHSVCEANNGLAKSQKIAFIGPVLLDHDGAFLEVHPSRIWLNVS
jgi:hypothetical protein